MKKRESHLHEPVKSVGPLREICGTPLRVYHVLSNHSFLLDVTTTDVTIIFSISFALSMSLLWESSQVCVYIYSIFACLRQADGKQSDVIFTTTWTTLLHILFINLSLGDNRDRNYQGLFPLSLLSLNLYRFKCQVVRSQTLEPAVTECEGSKLENSFLTIHWECETHSFIISSSIHLLPRIYEILCRKARGSSAW